MEPIMEEQEKRPVDHSCHHCSIESHSNIDSRQLVGMRSHQSEQCDHVWESVHGADHNFIAHNTLDSVRAHCYKLHHVSNCKLGLVRERML